MSNESTEKKQEQEQEVTASVPKKSVLQKMRAFFGDLFTPVEVPPRTDGFEHYYPTPDLGMGWPYCRTIYPLGRY